MSDQPNVKVTAGLGSNHVINNMPETQTIKAYEQAPIKIQVPPDSQVKKESAISFEKVREEEAPVQVTETTQEVEKPATSAERRDAMKRANAEHAKAIQMQKEAKELLAQAQYFEQVKAKAATNPVEVAKALGMDPTEFLRRYQNEMFNVPNEEPAKPEPTVEERLKQYEQERQKEKDAASKYQSEMTRLNYITTKILPTIQADAEKFQLLNYNNVQTSAGFIYDMMNDHFQRTGEELNATDVAEEYENLLQQEFEEKIAQVKKIGKFSKHFAKLEEEVKEDNSVSTVSNQLGSTKWTGAKSPVPVQGKSNDKKSRLERIKKL